MGSAAARSALTLARQLAALLQTENPSQALLVGLRVEQGVCH